MKIAVLADIHGSFRQIKKISKYLKKMDLVFIAGDIAGTISFRLIFKSIIRSKKVSRKKYAELVFKDYLAEFTNYQLKTTKSIIDYLRKNTKNLFLTHGNADTEGVRDYLEKIENLYANIHYIGNDVKSFGDLVIAGYGYCQPHDYLPAEAPGIKSKTEIEHDLLTLQKKISKLNSKDKTLVALFHEPPFDSNLDFVPPTKLHVGNPLMRTHIEKINYEYVFAGHVHESSGFETFGSKLWINPGPLVNGFWAILDTNTKEVTFRKSKSFISLKSIVYRLRDLFI